MATKTTLMVIKCVYAFKILKRKMDWLKGMFHFIFDWFNLNLDRIYVCSAAMFPNQSVAVLVVWNIVHDCGANSASNRVCKESYKVHCLLKNASTWNKNPSIHIRTMHTQTIADTEHSVSKSVHFDWKTPSNRAKYTLFALDASTFFYCILRVFYRLKCSVFIEMAARNA